MTKKTVKNKCDKLFSQYIRMKGFCESCGSRDNLQTAHIITRTIGKLRFEPKNALCLCARCHKIFHDRPIEFADFVKKTKGERTYKWLIKESNNLESLDIKYYQGKANNLEQLIDEMGNCG